MLTVFVTVNFAFYCVEYILRYNTWVHISEYFFPVPVYSTVFFIGEQVIHGIPCKGFSAVQNTFFVQFLNDCF